MDKLQKFLLRAPHLRKRLSAVLRAISVGNMTGLDIKSPKGQKGHYRYRVGDVRILFVRTETGSIAYDIDFRGNAYKK